MDFGEWGKVRGEFKWCLLLYGEFVDISGFVEYILSYIVVCVVCIFIDKKII